jgi:uncharacterized protein YgiM (DUF1202 family)/lipoprotein NlpI
MQRLFLSFALLLAFATTVSAQEDCSEFTDAAGYAARGQTAFDQRLFDDAILDYTCAIQLAPDTADYLNERGSAYYWLQRDAEARDDYMRVLELDPEAGYAYNNLANLYAGIGDYEQALTYYGMAISLPSGNDEITHTNRAIILMDTGDYEGAQADLDAARAINPAFDNLYLVQAGLYSIQNNTQEAAENYRQWLEITETARQTPQYVFNRSYVTSMTTGDVLSVALTASAGDTLNFSAAAVDNLQRVDPLIVLIAPDGTAVAADDDSGVNIDAVISDFVVEETGSYTLLVGNAGGYYHEGVDGRVRISLERKNAEGTVTVEPTPDATAAADIEDPVESEAVTASFSTFRLFVGERAEVFTTEGDRLNLRGGPGLRFEIIGKLDKGAFVTLLEGPRKQDGLAWWKVRTADGTEGWAVERVDTEQTLQLALSVGEEAIVTTDEDTLNMRSGAGRGNDIVVQLGDGERVTLLEVTPELVDGFQWWRVRLADGREGWVIDRLEGERLLVPAKELDGEG